MRLFWRILGTFFWTAACLICHAAYVCFIPIAWGKRFVKGAADEAGEFLEANIDHGILFWQGLGDIWRQGSDNE